MSNGILEKNNGKEDFFMRFGGSFGLGSLRKAGGHAQG
jgi:hypothetical protein